MEKNGSTKGKSEDIRVHIEMCVFLSYRWAEHYSKTIPFVALGKENVRDMKLWKVIPLPQFCTENIDEKFLKQNCTLILNSSRQPWPAFIKLWIIAACIIKMFLCQLMYQGMQTNSGPFLVPYICRCLSSSVRVRSVDLFPDGPRLGRFDMPRHIKS